jgi:tetratricopeptide (TPR) repeat protein
MGVRSYMTKSSKASFRIALCLLLCFSWISMIECQKPYAPFWESAQDSEEPNSPEIPSPPTSDSSSYSSYYDYISMPQVEEKIFFIKNAYSKTQYNKNETIRVILAIINKKNGALLNVTIEDQIPDPFKLVGNNYTIKKDGITYYSRVIRNKPIDLDKLNKSCSAYIEYNITTNIANEGYFLPPAMLSVNLGFWDGNRSLQSVPVYIRVVDRNPIIENIQVSPNPVHRDIIEGKLNNGKGVKINATFKDLDEFDLDRCELWSSLDGSVYNTPLNLSNYTTPTEFDYTFFLKNLSEGNNKLTIKLYDRDNNYAEETVELSVKSYFWLFPWEYEWVIIAAILAAILSKILHYGFVSLYDTRVLPIVMHLSVKPFHASKSIASKWNDIGLNHISLVQSDAAIKAFDKAIEMNPKCAAAWNNKGRVLYSLGRHKEAIRCSKRAIDLDPSYRVAWLNIGLVLQELGREEASAYLFMAREGRHTDSVCPKPNSFKKNE